MVKNTPVNAGDVRDTGLIPGSGRSPGGGMATHSNILAWEIPRTEEPGGLQSIGSQSWTRLKRLSPHTVFPSISDLSPVIESLSRCQPGLPCCSISLSPHDTLMGWKRWSVYSTDGEVEVGSQEQQAEAVLNPGCRAGNLDRCFLPQRTESPPQESEETRQSPVSTSSSPSQYPFPRACSVQEMV